MPFTSSQLIALSSRFEAAADQVEAKRSTVPLSSDEWRYLTQARRALTRASSNLLDTELNAALNDLEPHYDAMLSVVRDLSDEISKEQQIAKVLSIVASALAICSAVTTGDPAGLLTALKDAKLLIT